MNIFLIPSWYPTPDHPTTGIFIREHARLLAACLPDARVGISLWGSHLNSRLLTVAEPLQLLPKILKREKAYTNQLSVSCTEYFTPAFTWSRAVMGGNINGIVRANAANWKRFEKDHGKPDIIHAYVAHPAGYVAMELSKALGVPYVITEEMSPFPLPSLGKSGALSPWVARPYQHASANIAVSDALKGKMEKELIPNLTVVPNFIDEDFFSGSLTRRPAVSNFLFVGRLEHQKGVDVLLHAVRALNEKGQRHLHFVIGGDGSLAANLKQLAHGFGIDGMVSWAGELTAEQVRVHMEQCDAFILPSRHETFGIVVAEAMAMGKPVIVTRCGGPEEFVTPDAGLVIEPENVEALTGAIGRLIVEFGNFQPEQIRMLCLQSFSKKKVTSQLLEIYQKAISDFGQASQV